MANGNSDGFDVPRLKRAVRKAIRRFLKADSELLDLKVGEQACAHRLANYIADEVGPPDGHSIDIEFSRMMNDELSIKKNLPGLIPIWKQLQKAKAGKRRKNRTGDVRPDVILHRRSGPESNGLVVEVKLSGRGAPLDRAWDLAKLQEFTKAASDRGLGYRLGVFIDLGLPTSVRWFVLGRETGAEIVRPAGRSAARLTSPQHRG